MQYETIGLTPCIGPGVCNIAWRTLYGSCDFTNGLAANSANMAAWMNAYDLTTIPWGQTRYAYFNTYTDTTPTGGIATYADGGHTFSRTDLYLAESFIPPQPSVTSDIIMSQMWMGAPRAYMVIGIGFTSNGVNAYPISVCGCTFTPMGNSACASTILNLPIPNAALGYYCQEYIMAFVGPETVSGSFYPDLATFEAARVNNRGSNWNPNAVCAPYTGDPFANQ